MSALRAGAMSALRAGAMKWLVALALVAGCNAPEPAAIRDARPTRLQPGERMLVEASAPIFTVGAPTRVRLEAFDVALYARAVAPDRVIAMVVDGRHVAGPSAITVTQGDAHWSSDA